MKFINLKIIVAFITLVTMLFPLTVQAEQLDFNCRMKKLIDPDFVCDDVTNDDLSGITINETANTDCGTCDPDTSKCYAIGFNNSPNTSAYHHCAQVYDNSFSQCGGNCSQGEKCILLNPIQSSTAFNPNAEAEKWQCLNPAVLTFNLLGTNVGPLNVFVPKLIRLIFSVLFAFIGVILSWQLFTALWEYSTSGEQSQLEAVQKKIVNTMFGIFFILASIVIVQILASAFGIGGNIFDFSYP